MSRVAGRGFMLGFGSNLAPERHVSAVISALTMQFNQLYLSRIVYTAPEAVSSPQWFINMAMFIPCAHSEHDLKMLCNRIETDLGRDRSHPQRKWRDRAADLDILHHCHDVSVCTGWQVKENYLTTLVDELLAYVQNRPVLMTAATTAHIYMKEMPSRSLGQTPTTVHRDHTSGLIRII